MVYFLVVLPLEIVGLLVLPFVLLFIPKDQEYLPKLFRWFDNHERYTYQDTRDGIDGLAGDIPYRKRNKIYPYGEYSYLKNLWHRYHWLAIRNPLNYFQYFVLGKRLGSIHNLVVVGDPKVGDLPGQHQGLRYTTCSSLIFSKIEHNSSSISYKNKPIETAVPTDVIDNIWEIYIVKKIFPSEFPIKCLRNRGLRLRIGTKLPWSVFSSSKDIIEDRLSLIYGQWTLTINPLKKIESD